MTYKVSLQELNVTYLSIFFYDSNDRCSVPFIPKRKTVFREQPIITSHLFPNLGYSHDVPRLDIAI